jgi:hypothetical protein
MSIPQRPALREDTVVAELPDGEVMVATREGEQALLLNETGAIVVSLCTGAVSVDEMVSVFAESSGADAEVVAKDIRAVLESLAREGLLRSAGDGDDTLP